MPPGEFALVTTSDRALELICESRPATYACEVPEWAIALIGAGLGLAGGIGAAMAGPWMTARHADRQWLRERRTEAVTSASRVITRCSVALTPERYGLEAAIDELTDAASDVAVFCSEEFHTATTQVLSEVIALSEIAVDEQTDESHAGYIAAIGKFDALAPQETRLRQKRRREG